MLAQYHIKITQAALRNYLSPNDLSTIIAANLRQDRLIRLILHPEYHFDDSDFVAGLRYMAEQRQIAVTAIVSRQDRQAALRAFGRLLHACQDFYAHSNWAALWVARHGGLAQCRPDQIEPCRDPLSVAGLRSGTASVLVYLLYRLPFVGRWLQQRGAFPASHEAMHLDHAGRGPLFPFAVAAATKHTRLEFEQLLRAIEDAGGTSMTAIVDPLGFSA